MASFRLPRELEEKLASVCAREGVTKSEMIREALKEYLARRENSESPYELGKDLFGKYGSGVGNLSTEYKKRVREKIHAKMSH